MHSTRDHLELPCIISINRGVPAGGDPLHLLKKGPEKISSPFVSKEWLARCGPKALDGLDGTSDGRLHPTRGKQSDPGRQICTIFQVSICAFCSLPLKSI